MSTDPIAVAAPDAPAQRRCLLFWLVALLLPTLLVLVIGLPWWQRTQALAEQLAGSEEQLERLRRLVGQLPTLRAELAREQANDDYKAFYFDASTPALAGAQIQREVQDLVSKVGARIISAQVLPADPAEQPLRVPLRIQLQGTTDQLFDVLYELEAARPFLFIDQLSIRSSAQAGRAGLPPRARARRGGRVPNLPVPGELTVRLDLFGFVLGPGPTAAGPGA